MVSFFVRMNAPYFQEEEMETIGGSFPVVVRPLEPELRIIPCRGFVPRPEGTSVDFSTRSVKEVVRSTELATKNS